MEDWGKSSSSKTDEPYLKISIPVSEYLALSKWPVKNHIQEVFTEKESRIDPHI